MFQRKPIYMALTGALTLYSPVGVAQEVASQGAALPEVAVQASKQGKTEQKINGSTSVVSGATLEQANVSRTDDLQRALPDLYLPQQGNSAFITPSLRGVASLNTYNPAVVMYVDGVPQFVTAQSQLLTNVEQVELLRGPQGSLFGRNAAAGVINIVTRQPDNELAGHVEGGFGNRGRRTTTASISGPLVKDSLYGEAVIAYDSADGFLRSLSSGQDNVGMREDVAGQVKLRYAPVGGPLDVRFMASHECVRSAEDNYVSYTNFSNRVILDGNSVPGLATMNSYMKRCIDNMSLSADYDFSDYRLSLVTARNKVDIRERLLGAQGKSMPESQESLSQEVRLATRGTGRAWDGVVGAYFEHGRYKQRSSYVLFPTFGTDRSQTTTDSAAVFVDGTWHVTPRWDVSAGARLVQDKAETSGVLPIEGVAAYAASTSSNKALGKLSTGYQLTPSLRSYASLSQGYKPGGYNLQPTSANDSRSYRPETSLNYEMGLKFNTPDQKVSARAAVFQIESRNTQLYQGIVGSQYLTNAGQARSRGIEANLSAEVLRNWTLGLDAQVVDSIFTDYRVNSSTDYTGNKLPFVPRYILAASLSGRIATDVGMVRPRVAARYIGQQQFDAANSLKQQGYMLVDGQVSWRATSKLDVSFYINNAFDKRYLNYAATSNGLKFATLGEGREFGVKLRYDF